MRGLKRRFLQFGFFFLQNPFIANFYKGKIYTGNVKRFCTPGLNCYSCPAAVTSCPIGATQLFLAGVKHNISLFVTGFLLTVGMIFGRFICGYVCPFGLFQDLLWKIKIIKKRHTPLKYLKYVKYIVLALFVVILPITVINPLSGLGSPWFCKYICPSGTIFGAIPLILSNEVLRTMTGRLFALKLSVAIAIIVVSTVIYRFFCRVLCPLGAFYALFNRVSVVKMGCDSDKCNLCGKCKSSCKINIDPVKMPNSPECIRCGDCVRQCKTDALEWSILNKSDTFQESQ